MGFTSSQSSERLSARSLRCLRERESCSSSHLTNPSLLLKRAKRQRQRERCPIYALLPSFAPKCETETAKASSACVSSLFEEEASASSAACSLRKGLESFLSFLFFSFSLLSLLDLESLGILLSLLARLSVLRLSSGGNLVSLGVLTNLDVQVARSGW